MTDTGPSDAPPRRWPRWKGVVLIVSLALNLLVLGIVATAGLRYGFGPPHLAGQATVVNFARTLPPERKRLIWDATRAERSALRPHWAELRKSRTSVRAALTAEPFDAGRYKAAHDRLLQAELNVRREAHRLVEMVAMRLTPDERRKFADWQRAAERPWRRNRHKGGERDAGDDPATDPETPASPPAEPAAIPGKP